MPGKRYSQLNEAQRDTLRLYHAHLQIKEIAETLGVSESTVNNRLAQSRTILGLPSSRAAARWMAEHEQALGLWRKSTNSFSAMATSPKLAPSGPVGMSENERGTDEEQHTIEELGGGTQSSTHGFPWPFPTARRQENDLSWKTRLALVLPVAVLLMVCAMTLVVLGLGFQELLVSLEAWVSRLP